MCYSPHSCNLCLILRGKSALLPDFKNTLLETSEVWRLRSPGLILLDSAPAFVLL